MYDEESRLFVPFTRPRSVPRDLVFFDRNCRFLLPFNWSRSSNKKGKRRERKIGEKLYGKRSFSRDSNYRIKKISSSLC